MRAPLVFCVVAIFHVVFVASRDEDHQMQNSTITRDVECKTNCTKPLRDQILMTLISSNEKNDYKPKGRVNSLRTKRRTTHRLHPKSSARSRNSTIRGNRGIGQQADRVLPVSNETDLYEGVDVFLWNRTSDSENIKIHIGESLDDYYPFYGGLESLLARLIKALENNSKEDDDDDDVSTSSGAVDDTSGFDDEDRCQKWLDNWEKIESAFPGSVADLPACPCLYPNGIFYDNQIWDKKRQRKFRWRDVSHDKDRLAIYKPGAVYCVQTLPSQENESAIVQHCCYGENRKLLTRGSGAGTPYIVSPEISPLLHDKIDLLPWRLCKGDFTRYNEVRLPNNNNNCETNPDNEEYRQQVARAKNY